VTDTFVCARCGGTFEKVWSDADASAEARALWGVRDSVENPTMVLVCDACWAHIQPRPFRPQVPPDTG
jgi:hypothetical protein